MTADEAFGLRTWRALKERDSQGLITSRLPYATVQKLKAADRFETIALLGRPDYEALQRLKAASPEELVELYLKAAEAAARGTGTGAAFWPLIFGSLW